MTTLSEWKRKTNLILFILLVTSISRIRDGQEAINWTYEGHEGIGQYLPGNESKTTPTFEGSPSYSNLTSESSAHKNYDIVFWYKYKPPTIDLSSLVVTRDFQLDNPRAPEGPHVLQVDFQKCGEYDCAKYLDHFPSPAERRLWQYDHFAGHTISILSRCHNIWKSNFSFEAITFWSSRYERHVAIQNVVQEVKMNSCGDEGNRCPKPCPQNVEAGPSAFPYVRDSNDGICKSTLPEVMPPIRNYGGQCGCRGTCFTPETGDPLSIWPYTNVTEKQTFEFKGDPEVLKAAYSSDSECGIRRKNQGYKARFICTHEPNRSLPCPLLGAFSHHLYFVPRAKLILCGIPKVGITEWIKFVRYVAGAKDYLSHPHYKIDRKNFLLSSLDPSLARDLLMDPSWTKAAFIRNPLERLLSAYMDKIRKESYTQKVFNIGSLSMERESRPMLSFADFVDKVTNTSEPVDCNDPNGLKGCTDPHWRPQLMTCGLDYLLPHFDFIGNFDFIADHSKNLLEKVGLWEEYGSTFDDGKTVQSEVDNGRRCSIPPLVNRSATEKIWGFNQQGPSGMGFNLHSTNSREKLEQFYTPDLIEKVQQAYHLDFAVWDEISSQPTSNKPLSGRDLRVVHQHCPHKDQSTQ